MPISLPVYNESYRPSSNWTKTLIEKQKALETLLPLEPSLQNKIKKHLFVKKITNNLQLSGVNVDLEKVSFSIEKPSEDSLEIIINNFANAVKYIDVLIDKSTDKSKILLTSDLLRELHALIFLEIDEKAGFYRESSGKPIAPNHQPVPADVLPILVDNALDWFNTDSFRELHPLEQAWLVHLRIVDLQPFEKGNSRLARLVASIYAERLELAPIIINPKEQEFYTYAVNNSLVMITQPGVELFARSVIETYEEIFSIISNSRL